MPTIINQLLEEARIVFCALEDLPATDKLKKSFVFVDDAHTVSKPQLMQVMRLLPERVVLLGNSQLVGKKHQSLFSRLIQNEGYFIKLTSQHRLENLMRKVNETLF